MKMLKKALLFSILSCTLLNADIKKNIPEVDEKLMDTLLSRLIYGVNCNEALKVSPFDSSVLWVYDKDKVDMQKIPSKIRYIRFAGRILAGGIYDENSNTYISADKEFAYSLQGNDLWVRSICDKQQFVLKNYDKEKEGFNLKLRQKPDKEIAIVINNAHSMKDYVLAFKEIAPFIAKHIFREESKEYYSKITLVVFNSDSVKDYDDVFSVNEFIRDVKGLKIADSKTKLVNYALVEAMSHFTKDNGLKKEIYLITDGNPNDIESTKKMLSLTKNLNNNSVHNSEGSKRNWVTIHTLALDKNLNALRELTQATEGNFYEPNGIYEFKKLFLRLSNNGEDVDPREIGNEIVPSKTHKIYDPEHPDVPPTRK